MTQEFEHPWLREDYKDLLEHGQIKRAIGLSKELTSVAGKAMLFSHTGKPHHAVRNLDAKTVFAHLNPGASVGAHGSTEAFFETKCKKEDLARRHELDAGAEVEELLAAYKKWSVQYAHQRFVINGDFDNFDYKQACFLLHWPDSGIDLKNGNLKDRSIQRHNIVNVLDQKLQLELIPYASNTTDTHLLSRTFQQKPEILVPYVKNLLDTIALYPRKYVLFGSRLYQTLFRIYHQKVENIIDFESPEEGFENITQNRLSFSFMRLNWDNKKIHTGIAHSFARRDLPNSYDKMAEYGQKSYLHFIKYQNN
jgi:hypothetical protein